MIGQNTTRGGAISSNQKEDATVSVCIVLMLQLVIAFDEFCFLF